MLLVFYYILITQNSVTDKNRHKTNLKKKNEMYLLLSRHSE
jgi:hypothetical protein